MSLVLILAGDTVAVRSLIMSLELERFEVKRVVSGDELLGLFSSAAQAGLMIDLAAPWDGLLPLIRRLRAHGTGRAYRLVLFGSLPPQASAAVLQTLGVSEEDIFTEPVDMSRLIPRLRQLPSPATESKSSVARSPLGFPVQAPLEDARLASVLASIALGNGTGELEVEMSGGRAQLFFKDGKLATVEAPTGSLSLPQFLVRLGRLKPPHVDTLARLGPITLDSLVANHVLSPHEVAQVAKDHSEAVVRALVGPARLEYKWHQGVQPKQGGFPLETPLPRLILDAFKASPTLSLSAGQASTALSLEAAQKEALRAWQLLPLELRVVNLADGSRTIQSIIETVSGAEPSRQRDVMAVVLALRAMFTPIRLADEEEVVDWSQRQEELREDLERMKGASPFEVLGVTPQTPLSDVRSRFFALSKQYHPDRAFNAEPEIKALMQEIFRAVQEAYEVVSDPKRLEAFNAEQEMGKGGLDVKNAINAEIAFSQGELYLKNKNFAKAKEFFAEALQLNPHGAEYRALLGWATFLLEGDRYAEAVKLIHQALKEHPVMDRGFYFLGFIAKARNELNQAEAAFKKAVEINPNNIEARRELRLMEMRRDKKSPAPEKSEPEKPKKGFFGLFKR